jgi:hypothetical protein
MDRDQLASIRDQALKRLQKRNKDKDVHLTQTLVDRVPSSGRRIFQLAGVDKANPTEAFVEVVVDENGEEVNLKELSKREGKTFFGGERRPQNWWWYRYSYSVKIVCGTQPVAEGCCLPAVRPGIYATEVNIHNFHPTREASIQKSVLPVVLAGMPLGREPRYVYRRGWDWITLPPDTATMDDCCRIRELLFDSSQVVGAQLTVGFLEIVSDVELKVTAVYTATDHESRSVSIDVEDVSPRIKSWNFWWTDDPRIQTGSSAANPALSDR